MRKAPFLRRSALIILLAFGVFVLGAAFQKYRFFPYQFLKIAVSEVNRQIMNPKEALSRLYSRDVDKVAQGRAFDTALLPLEIKGVRISEHYPVAKGAGGITTVGNTVIVLDRLGNIYSCNSGGDLKKLPFPELPNNIADYLAQLDAVVDDNRLRAYNIKYLDFAKLLAVSHEYFDKQNKKSRIAVSVIGFDEKLLQPTGSWETIFLGDLEPEGPNENAGGVLAAQSPDRQNLPIGRGLWNRRSDGFAGREFQDGQDFGNQSEHPERESSEPRTSESSRLDNDDKRNLVFDRARARRWRRA